MSLRKVFPQLIDVTGASDGDILQYVDANAKVEFVTSSSIDGGNSDVLQDNLNRLDANVSSNTNTVQDNVASASSNITALDTSIGTVQSNIDTYATYANSTFGAVTGYTFTKLIAGGANVVANVATDTLTFTAGNNITINADAASDTITFKASLSNSVNNYFIANGSTNAFTLTQAASSNLDILVSVEGLLQSPDLHYQVSSTTLTLMNTLPIENGTEVMVRWIPNTTENTPGISPYSFQGTVSGYASAGGPTASNVIDKFPFSSDANATDVGDLTVATRSAAGQSSRVSGYTSGGSQPTRSDIIDKFPFSTDANATDVGELTEARYNLAGNSSETSGYSSGGRTPTDQNIIDKFPFSTDANATDVGDLTVARGGTAGQSSSDNGYVTGRYAVTPSYTDLDVIDKFPFASDANATDVGNLTVGRGLGAGQSSTTHGYQSGGTFDGINTIDKFSFSSDGNATDVGDLTVARGSVGGQSSTTSGYTSGGSPTTNIIDKFPFSSDANATDVGDLTVSRWGGAGQQV